MLVTTRDANADARAREASSRRRGRGWERGAPEARASRARDLNAARMACEREGEDGATTAEGRARKTLGTRDDEPGHDEDQQRAQLQFPAGTMDGGDCARAASR